VPAEEIVVAGVTKNAGVGIFGIIACMISNPGDKNRR
jgi:hypothetical protein